MLVAGRLFIVFFVAGALLVAFAFARRVLGDGPAALGVALVALSPFHVGLSRLLHLDALLSALVLASLSALMAYMFDGRRQRDLIISGVAAGLAWLTKSPGLFLVPLVGAMLLWDARRQGAWPQGLQTGGLWGLVGMTAFVGAWPAMWVTPWQSVAQVLATATTYAEVGHLNPTFFMGRVYEADPGWLFYPVNYLWRETPVVLAGLILAAVAWSRRHGLFADTRARAVAGWLVAAALAFGLVMSLGAKKFDRYLLPAFPLLALVAAQGWWALVERARRWQVATAWLLVGVVMCGQGVGTLTTFPYYLSYYNPVLGGARRAPRVMLIGWGEGLDVAARYLNAKPGAEQLRVTTWYMDGPFSYYFTGEAMPIRFRATMTNVIQWLSTDYVVTYANQWQRGLPTRELLEYFEQQVPEKVITINGLEYARIYDVRGVPPPDYLAVGRPRFTDWGGQIRLVAYRLPARVMPGETFVATFYLQSIAPIERNLNVLVRVVGPGGRELLRDEGWPWGSPTSTWRLRDVWPDGHTFTVPAEAPPGIYRVELTFYDPQTLERLPAVDVNTGAPIGDTLVVDLLQVGSLPAPQRPLMPKPRLGEVAVLVGWDLVSDDGAPVSSLRPGESVRVRLHWQALQESTVPYKGFVHLLAPDGTLVPKMTSSPRKASFPRPSGGRGSRWWTSTSSPCPRRRHPELTHSWRASTTNALSSDFPSPWKVSWPAILCAWALSRWPRKGERRGITSARRRRNDGFRTRPAHRAQM
ncbi:MAG: glycosyltransferase family 39 protein [Ardenticatenia bacterium]|nr:glycosyltransferase family 39 protein [Ardenticatenia bacterium]